MRTISVPSSTDFLIDDLDEVFSRLNLVNIHEHLAGTEVGHETVIESPRVGCAVIAAIA